MSNSADPDQLASSDLHCLQRQGISGFSRTRDNCKCSFLLDVKCTHTEQVAPVPESGLDCNAPCEDCDNTGENWVCLICYKVRKTLRK